MLGAVKAILRKIGELRASPSWARFEGKTVISPDEISDEERDRIIERVAEIVVRRGFTTPALLFIELAKPINFIASQFLVALDPLVSSVLTSGDYRRFSILMEDDENVERLLQAIERLSSREGGEDG